MFISSPSNGKTSVVTPEACRGDYSGPNRERLIAPSWNPCCKFFSHKTRIFSSKMDLTKSAWIKPYAIIKKFTKYSRFKMPLFWRLLLQNSHFIKEMVYKYFSSNNIFKIHKFTSPKTSNIKYFWTFRLHHQGVLCDQFIHTLMLRKWKSIWICHCSGNDLEGGIKEFFKG